MADIKVKPVGGDRYLVTVTETGSATSHEVTAGASQVEQFGAVTAEDLIEASFEFLLDREPKESILGRFDLSVITSYFPEYPARISDYL